MIRFDNEKISRSVTAGGVSHKAQRLVESLSLSRVLIQHTVAAIRGGESSLGVRESGGLGTVGSCAKRSHYRPRVLISTSKIDFTAFSQFRCKIK